MSIQASMRIIYYLNITVYGHGEEIGDEWVLYVKAGKTEKHHVEFPTSTLW